MAIRGFISSGGEGSAETLCRRLAIDECPSATGRLQHCIAGCESLAHVDRVTVAVEGSARLLSDPLRAIDAHQIGRLVLEHGTGVLQRLCGSFALAVVDSGNGSVWLAVDPMGAGRMTFASEPGLLVFGSRADTVAGALTRPKRVSNQRLYDFLFFHMIPAPESVFEGVIKLEPGTVACWQGGKLDVRRYWLPRFRPDRDRSEELFAEELLDGLAGAVRGTEPDESTGAFLSGGLDSSTVAGMLRKVTGGAKTFSIGFGEPGYDELEYARCANQHFGCTGHEYNVSPADVMASFPLIAEAYDEPFGNSSAVPVLACARFAREHGVTHLLAGDGGDELFAGNERYAKQKVFEFYGRIPSGLRRVFLEPLARRFDPEKSAAPLRKLRSYVDQATTPLPERLETWNYVYREGMQNMLDPDFAAAIDLRGPIRQMDRIYAEAEADDFLDRLLAYDWHVTLADSDLRKVSSMCELAGVRVSYPMLDHRLIELALRIPPRIKLRRLELRSFYKRAMRGFLPEKILNKPKHGFGLPFGKWMKSEPRLAEMIYDRLHELKKRHIFRDGFIDDIIEQQQSGHHAYYGFFLWDLAMLEEWLARHA